MKEMYTPPSESIFLASGVRSQAAPLSSASTVTAAERAASLERERMEGEGDGGGGGGRGREKKSSCVTPIANNHHRLQARARFDRK